jgi:hypothetical protein
MEEYLTTKELSERIKIAPGTIRNLICKNRFIENVHFVRPTPRKVLFIWSHCEDWLYGKNNIENDPCSHKECRKTSLINI